MQTDSEELAVCVNIFLRNVQVCFLQNEILRGSERQANYLNLSTVKRAKDEGVKEFSYMCPLRGCLHAE